MQSLQGRACFADAQQLCAADLCDLDALEPVEWVSLPRVLDPKGQVVDGVGQVDRDVPERLQVVHMKRGLLEVAAHPKVEVPRDLLHLDRTCEPQQPNGEGGAAVRPSVLSQLAPPVRGCHALAECAASHRVPQEPAALSVARSDEKLVVVGRSPWRLQPSACSACSLRSSM